MGSIFNHHLERMSILSKRKHRRRQGREKFSSTGLKIEEND
jgi:hypothetical protein